MRPPDSLVIVSVPPPPAGTEINPIRADWDRGDGAEVIDGPSVSGYADRKQPIPGNCRNRAGRGNRERIVCRAGVGQDNSGTGTGG